jgi:hypothetical protein
VNPTRKMKSKPSRGEPCKKNEIKTFLHVFQFFLATVRIES